MKRWFVLAAVYVPFMIGGITCGGFLQSEPFHVNDIVAAAILAPVLNFFVIAASALDERFPLTLCCWFVWLIGAVVWVRNQRRLGLIGVALASFIMNLATLTRFWGVMSV